MQKILLLAAACLVLFALLFLVSNPCRRCAEPGDQLCSTRSAAHPADLGLDLQMLAPLPPLPKTWTIIEGNVYGAKPDHRGPIGGAKGYSNIVTNGDYRPTSLDGLLDALQQAMPGQVVFLAQDIEIDCTERIYIEKLVLEVPAGVTLASNRGQGYSRGAVICSDALATAPIIRAVGQNVRITGLRIIGPDPKPRMDHHRRCFSDGSGRGHDYYYKFPISRGIVTKHPRLEVDNCELAGFSHAAIFLQAGRDHHIHHNYIHHNQYNGLGYGVVHATASSLIEQNLFNYNRHSIAGSGQTPSGYEACNNVEIQHSLSHCFDMHGGRDRNDGTDIAGTQLSIHHNTFWSPQRAIVIRGLPEEGADIHHNWFYQDGSDLAKTIGHSGHVTIRENAFGLTDPTLK